MPEVLFYTVAFGNYDCTLAQMVVESLRASGFSGDAVVFTDRECVFAEAVCINVAALDKVQALKSAGSSHQCPFDAPLNGLVMPFMPKQFFDLTPYEFLLYADTDILFFENPCPTWLDPDWILLAQDTKTLAANLAALKDHLCVDEAVTTDQPGAATALYCLPRKFWPLLEEWRALLLQSDLDGRHKIGAQSVLNYLLCTGNYPFRFLDKVARQRKQAAAIAVHYGEHHHLAMRAEFLDHFRKSVPKAVGGTDYPKESRIPALRAKPLERPLDPRILLGKQRLQNLQLGEAEELFRQILEKDPADVDSWFHLGLAQQQQNKLLDAMDSFRNVVCRQSEHVDGHTHLGIVLARLGKQREGETHLRQALRLRPGHAMAHNNLGVALAEMGQPNQALSSWQEAVRCDPNYPEAHFNLAVALADKQRQEEAVIHYLRALQLRPNYAEAYSNLGLLRIEQRRPAEAVILLEQAVRLKPDFVDAYNNLGLAKSDLGRPEEALTSYHEALRRRPDDADLHNNLGTALAGLYRLDEALACYEQALRLKPGYAEVHWHRALAWLQQGNFSQGWPEYEWRWQRKRSQPRPMEKPLWNGGSLEKKTVLLWCEQGLGDTLQFVRYASSVKALGATVLVECPAGLIPLLSSCPGVDRCVAERTELASFDFHAPLLSLPGIFKTTLASIPAPIPYLEAEAARVAKWRDELASLAGTSDGIKIGIAWQGNPKHRWDQHRSVPLEYFHVLARLQNVHLFSLQKGPGIEQVADFARRFPLVELGSRLDEEAMFVDTAAVMQSLDVVITCDSSLAHLAGALGVAVWVAVPIPSDWRWLTRRCDSPWYPSLRLFRQKKRGDWEKVFARIKKELTKLVATKKKD